MVNKNKIYDFIKANLKRLDKNWTEELEDLNIWDDVFELYCIKITTTKIEDDIPKNVKSQITEKEANTVLAFIILAYDNRSEYLEPHKDRFDNKVKILVRLAGPTALSNELYHSMVYSQEETCNKIINWYIDFQKDWRWKEILVSKEFASRVMAEAMHGEGVSKKLQEAKELNIEADKTLDILHTEFLNLDTILEKENRPKATNIELTNFMSHEGYIRARNKRQAEEEEIRKAEEEERKSAKK